jgi:hypothetical protein
MEESKRVTNHAKNVPMTLPRRTSHKGYILAVPTTEDNFLQLLVTSCQKFSE